MAKVGLKETLSLLAAGYKKKDIEALAAIDDEAIQQESDQPANDDKSQELESPEPDYKTMYEELLKKNKETESILTKLQQDNVHKDSAPDVEANKKEEAEALTNLVRSFM